MFCLNVSISVCIHMCIHIHTHIYMCLCSYLLQWQCFTTGIETRSIMPNIACMHNSSLKLWRSTRAAQLPKSLFL